MCCRRRAVAAVGCLRLVCTQDCSPHCPRASGAHVSRRDAATVAVHARRRCDPVISCPPSMTSVMFLQTIHSGRVAARATCSLEASDAGTESVEIELIGLQRAVGAYLGCGETFPVGGFGEEEFGLVQPYSPGLSIRPQQSKHPTQQPAQMLAMLGHARPGEGARQMQGHTRRGEGTRGHARRGYTAGTFSDGTRGHRALPAQAICALQTSYPLLRT